MKHELKIWPEHFQNVADGVKPFEVRKNDRDFNISDELVLNEWNFDTGFTGRKVEVTVTYIMKDPYFVKEGYVIMGITKKSLNPIIH
jgi:hypothetical protein